MQQNFPRQWHEPEQESAFCAVQDTRLFYSGCVLRGAAVPIRGPDLCLTLDASVTQKYHVHAHKQAD